MVLAVQVRPETQVELADCPPATRRPGGLPRPVWSDQSVRLCDRSRAAGPRQDQPLGRDLTH